MRWCVSIGAALVAGAIVGGDVAGMAAPGPGYPAAAEAIRWQGAAIVERLSALAADVELDGVDVRIARP